MGRCGGRWVMVTDLSQAELAELQDPATMPLMGKCVTPAPVMPSGTMFLALRALKHFLPPHRKCIAEALQTEPIQQMAEREPASPPSPRSGHSPLATLARFLGTTETQLKSLAKSFAIACAAGLAFQLAQLPLPWLLGPLSVALLFSVSQRPLAEPSGLVQPMRALLGVAVGSSFTPALLGKAGGAAASLALLVPYTVVLTAAGVYFLRRFARFDPATAFFAAAPGGLADMIMYARDAGADLRRVTLVQATRVLTIVVTLPFWLQFVGGQPLGGAMPKALHIWQLPLVDAVVIVATAWVGWRLADRLGLLGGSVVGPMLLSALLHGFGLTTAKVPIEVLVLAQVTLGLTIGSQFRGISLSEFVSVMSWALALAVLLLVAAGAMTLLTAGLTGLEPTSLLLSYAPGGQNEMAIIGLILGADVAIIALHHLLRVVMVVVGAQLVFQSRKDWHRDKP